MSASPADPTSPAGDGPLGQPAPAADLTPLDFLVYAPAGLVLTVVDDFPELVARGRARIDQQVRTARAIGQLAVLFGRRDLERRVGQLLARRPGAPRTTEGPPMAAGGPVAPASPGAPAGTGGTGAGDGPDGPGRPDRPDRPAEPPARPAGAGPTERADAPDPVERAIPGYDLLSASQVVRRLDSLGPAELAAVAAHETATRNRRTILHRVEQLSGSGPGGPGPDAGAAAPAGT